jgi:chromosome segregation ATPase
LLVDPVTLLCGYSVCKRHLDDLLENTPKEINKFECQLCKKKHCIPEDGFAINKRIQNGLNIKLSTLKVNPVYEECKTEINEAKNNIQKIENLENDPENYSFEYFEELKRQVDLRREELKLKLDNCSDEIIQSIERTKDNCIKLSRESKRLNTEIENSKKELTELMDDFDTFEIDNEKFEDIRQSLTVLNGGLTRQLGEYKDSIIGDKKYSFEFEEIDIKGLFGSFKEVEKVI